MAQKHLLVARKVLRRVLLLAFFCVGVSYAVYRTTQAASNSILTGPFQGSLLQMAVDAEHHIPLEPPFIVTCKAPYLNSKREAPLSVSLVEKQRDKPTNNVRVMNNRPAAKQDFAVCVKGLDFLKDDLSVRLIEWIELLNILGAQKIFLYELDIHPNISKTLQYYQQKGLVELTPITLPGDQPNLPGLRHNFLRMKVTCKRQNELNPYNDCLYRNLYSYKYIILLDVDEVIIPVQHHTWKQLMSDVVPMSLYLKHYTWASYHVRNVYFLDDMMNEDAKHTTREMGIPGYMHMLQHAYRAKNFSKAS
ncbi:hypothetical protein MTO96_006829 [Rhipicephalus appendiculatus]